MYLLQKNKPENRIVLWLKMLTTILKRKSNKQNKMGLCKTCLAGAEGLEPSARGFGAAQKWYYLVSPNAVKSKKNSNYQQSQDFVTLNNI